MKTIVIDSDVSRAILSNTAYVGETENSILRRIMCLEATPGVSSQNDEKIDSELSKLINSREFTFAKGAVGRFLLILKLIYKEHPGTFSRIEGIRGRGRLYFARDEVSLSNAGTSVNPKQIPDTPYWVITNTSTGLKNEILAEAMTMFGYSEADISRATASVSERDVR